MDRIGHAGDYIMVQGHQGREVCDEAGYRKMWRTYPAGGAPEDFLRYFAQGNRCNRRHRVLALETRQRFRA